MTKSWLKILLSLSLAAMLGCSGADKNTNEDATDELAAEAESDTASSDASDEDADVEEFGEEEAAESVAQDEPATEEVPPLAEEQVAVEPSAEAASPAESAIIPVDVPTHNRVTAINYLSSTNGGTIEIKTESPATYVVRPNPSTNQFVIEIQNAALDDSLRRPFIMKDFEGAFGAINAYQNTSGTTARIVVQLRSPGEPIVSQAGTSLLLVAADQTQTQTAEAQSVEKKEAAAQAASAADSASYDTKEAAQNEQILAAQTLDEFLTGSGKFFGRPISIQTNDADVRDVISFIAEESGVNLVISDDVSGKVSVKLRQVPWDQALVIVMRARGLGYVRQGNVLRITRLATLQAEATAAKEIVDSQKKLTPLKVKVIPVSYATVTDLATQIKPFLSEGRGQVVSDVRTSTVIITDTADVLARIERLVRELDIPPAQVMIEGKIIEAGENFSRNVGVNWGLTGYPVELNSSGGAGGTPITLSPSFGSRPSLPGTSFLSLRAGTVDLLGSLDATLNLAQSDNLVRIISSPRIVTINKEKAQISQKGETISLTTSRNEDTNIATAQPVRTSVELKLEVTPQITNEGSVVLDVSILRQFAGAEADTTTRARPINSREAKTKVLVPNGQTAVIGGIYQSDESESESGVPGLKNIPVLGWLFKAKSHERQKNELLLFLTPRILNAKDQSVVN